MPVYRLQAYGLSPQQGDAGMPVQTTGTVLPCLCAVTGALTARQRTDEVVLRQQHGGSS